MHGQYKTYQEAKTKHLFQEIYFNQRYGGFSPEHFIPPSTRTFAERGYVKCQPSDHCMTLDEFIETGWDKDYAEIMIEQNGVDYVIKARYPGDKPTDRRTLLAFELYGQHYAVSSMAFWAFREDRELLEDYLTLVDVKLGPLGIKLNTGTAQ